MDLALALKVVLRRWYLFVPILAITAALVALGSSSIPNTYRASADFVLLPATTTPDPDEAPLNPLLATGNYDDLLAVLVAVLDHGSTRAVLESEGASPNWAIERAFDGPVLTVRAEAGTEQKALTTVQLVLDATEEQLATLQAETDVEQSAAVAMRVLVQDDEASALYGSKMRLLAALGALGVGIGLGVVFTVDGVSRRRHAAREVAWAATEVPAVLEVHAPAPVEAAAAPAGTFAAPAPLPPAAAARPRNGESVRAADAPRVQGGRR